MTMVGTNVTASGNGGNGFVFNSGSGTNTLQYSNGTIAERRLVLGAGRRHRQH